jgi:transposase
MVSLGSVVNRGFTENLELKQKRLGYRKQREHLTLWEQELAKNMSTKTEDSESLKAANKKLEKDNRELQKELKRKEKALAEMAALYTLKKKAEEYWPENGEEK